MKYNSFTAIDFETANHKRSSACSIGLVKVENGEIVDSFTSLIKPEPCDFNRFNIGIHGIRPIDVKDAPTFQEIYPQISDWITDRILITHNASFEESVINALFKQYNLSSYPENYICTLYLSRIYIKEKILNYKLPTVYEYLFQKQMNHHNALADAGAAAEIALKVLGNWQPDYLEKAANALYVDGSNFKRRNKKKKTFTPSTIKQEFEYEGIHFLKGNSFVFTGGPTPYTKHEAAQIIVNLGGVVTTGVTKSTTHLICGELPSKFEEGHLTGKFKKVLELNKDGRNIQIIDAVLFEKLIKKWMVKLDKIS
jgi:DNA polymerase-3 subunit epsilon